MSDDTSLDEAMAAARNDDDRETTSHQLDAFHATFNFCMTCRQYTCGNCWNTAEGRCLTCAPHLGHEILPSPFPEGVGLEPIRIEAEAWPEVDLTVAAADASNGNGHGNGVHADPLDPWASVGPTDVSDIPEIDPAARLAFLSGETPSPVAAPEPAASSDVDTLGEAIAAEPWPVIAESTSVPLDAVAGVTAETGPAAERVDEAMIARDAAEVAERPAVEPLPPTVAGKADAGAARTADLLRRFRPGQNIDAELAAYEASVAPDSAEPTVEPATAAAAEIEPAAAAASEPVADVRPEAAPAPTGTAFPTLAWPTPASPDVPAAAVEPAITAAPGLASVPETPPAATPEPVAAAPDVVAAPEPIAAAAAPEPVVAAVEPEPEPVATAPEPIATAPEPIAAAPEPVAPPAAPAIPAAPIAAEPRRDDRVQQPTWQIFAPDASPAVGRPHDGSLPPAQPGPSGQPIAASADPQWPVRPDQVESPAMALLANRAKGSPSDGLWAASAQEVLARPAAAAVAGVQPCSSCGLSLSATARFCRRCGTRQG